MSKGRKGGALSTKRVSLTLDSALLLLLLLLQEFHLARQLSCPLPSGKRDLQLNKCFTLAKGQAAD